MSLDTIRSWLKDKQNTLQDGVKRYRNRDFMDAVVAGCALVSAADGGVSGDEKQKMAGFIQRSEELKIFDMNEVIQRFNFFTEGFGFDFMIGKGEALKAIAKMKKDTEASRLLIRLYCAIGMADGEFSNSEKKMVGEICTELGLKAEEFGL